MRLLYQSSILLLLLLSGLVVKAQDIHLSHIHASPTVLNPSLNGLFRGDTRLIANARTQWTGITNGYKTIVASVDRKLFVMRNADLVGGGLQLYTDVAGDLGFRTSSAALSLSMLKSLDGSGSNYVSFGIQNAFVTNSVDYTKIVANDAEPIVEAGTNDKIFYWDINAGLSWFYALDRDNSFYVGATLFHINQPKVGFFQRNSFTNGEKLYRRWLIHGGGDFRVGKRSYLKPSFIFQDQGPHREITLGSFWKFKTLKSHRTKSPSSIHFGAWVRWHADVDLVGTDAVVAAIRADYNQTYFTFTFDLNISSLTKVSYGRGGPELSVVHILENKRKRRPTKVRCPDF